MLKFKGLRFTAVEALAVILLVSVLGIAFAAIDVKTADLSTNNITVNGTETVYTHSFPTDRGSTSAISYYTESSNTNVTIQLEQSSLLPGTEGELDLNYTVPVNLSAIAGNLSTSGTWYQQTVNPVALPYGRIKIIGGADNAEDTTVNIKFNQQTYR